MRTRHRILLLGLALALLLALGVGAAILWPEHTEADRVAAKLEVGMTWHQARRVIWANVSDSQGRFPHVKDAPWCWLFEDGSGLTLTFAPIGQHVIEINTSPPWPVHPLTRLRRTLARLIPALGE